MGPHHSSVLLSLVGRGPDAALTSVCNLAPFWVGHLKCGVMGFCCSTDLSTAAPDKIAHNVAGLVVTIVT